MQKEFYYVALALGFCEGREVALEKSLVSRIFLPEEGKILEETINIKRKEKYRDYFIIDFENNSVPGENSFKLENEQGLYKGEGKLFGKPWNWHKWSFVVELSGGHGEVRSENKMLDDGTVIVNKIYKGPNGECVEYNGIAVEISKEEYKRQLIDNWPSWVLK